MVLMYHIFVLKEKAILLVGPTGIGKTPLGDLMEKKGLRGCRCFHFDFGANLRVLAAVLLGTHTLGTCTSGTHTLGTHPFPEKKNDVSPITVSPILDFFSPQERAVILDSLAGGALLENENFPIAEKILNRFVAEKGVGLDDLLIMNGLPRHAGQARDLERSVEVRAVVCLAGTAAVIKERIRLDAGGDRAGRGAE